MTYLSAEQGGALITLPPPAGMGQATGPGPEGGRQILALSYRADKTTVRKKVLCVFLGGDLGILGMGLDVTKNPGLSQRLEDTMTGDSNRNQGLDPGLLITSLPPSHPQPSLLVV